METSLCGASWASKRKRSKPDKGETCLDEKIGIDSLPDEVLILIVSCLGLREAAKTCVLSRRWAELWTFTVGALDFEASEALKRVPKAGQLERVSFVKWVDKVLNLHRGKRIDSFRVHFDLNQSSSAHIDNWVRFAMSKGVKKLDLNFESNYYSYPSRPQYVFPSLENLLRETLKNPNVYMLRSAYFSGLVSLRLKSVDVSGEVLEDILSSCKVLEELSVVGSNCLRELRVAGPSLNLKCLELSDCLKLVTCEIDAPNLKAFEYVGQLGSPLLKNLSSLSEMSVGCFFFVKFICKFPQCFNFYSQLNTLKLRSDFCYEVINDLPFNFPELRNLRHLEFTIVTSGNKSLLWCTTLIKASPLLHSFVIHLVVDGEPSRMFSLRNSPLWNDTPKEKEIRIFTKYPHQCLKLVRIDGFVGCRSDMDFAFHLLEIAVKLEKITINPWLVLKISERKAQHLRERLPPGAELVILNSAYYDIV